MRKLHTVNKSQTCLLLIVSKINPLIFPTDQKLSNQNGQHSAKERYINRNADHENAHRAANSDYQDDLGDTKRQTDRLWRNHSVQIL